MMPVAIQSCASGPKIAGKHIFGADKNLLSRLQLPSKLSGIWAPNRYKILHGGRGGAKSRSIASVLTLRAAMSPTPRRTLCAREYQTSIDDSVMELLKREITRLKLEHRFRFGKTYIETRKTGCEFIFKGLKIDPDKSKSMEGINDAWVEEAERVSEASWIYLLPTIREEDAEIYISFNPEAGDSPTYKRFVLNPPPGAYVVKLSWFDNPWFPESLDFERRYCLENDPDAYDWIWGGEVRKISDAQIFRGKFSVETFETPPDARFMHGADWGFGADPTTLVRMFERDDMLFIDRESYALRLDLDQIADTWRRDVPGCDRWQIYADNSQPQTINHVKSFGFKIAPAQKWAGSVEDGIKFARKYKKIVIHERCYYTAQEFKLYSYKTDRITGDVLPIIVDKHNHCIDAIRYGLAKRIKRRKGVF